MTRKETHKIRLLRTPPELLSNADFAERQQLIAEAKKAENRKWLGWFRPRIQPKRS